jgi:nitrite reductase (NADH) small subunit
MTAETRERIFVGKRSELPDGSRRIISTTTVDVGVIVHGGEIYAYRNRCAHQGGPACEGMIIGRVETVMAQDQTVVGHRFSEAEPHIVCPWHGWEYRLRDGQCVVDPRIHLRSHDVVIEGDDVYVVV